ncbi:MAG: VOC family protein [Candidatus Dadabacteria bacterium]
MPTKIFVNLPVKDLERSKEFFSKLGYAFNSQFTDEKAACMIISEDIYIMLLVEPFFKSFTNKEVADSAKSTEAIICLSADSRSQVDELVNRAISAGGNAPREKQDYGTMYGWGFEDIDGHLWEVMYMDPAAIKKQEDVQPELAVI